MGAFAVIIFLIIVSLFFIYFFYGTKKVRGVEPTTPPGRTFNTHRSAGSSADVPISPALNPALTDTGMSYRDGFLSYQCTANSTGNKNKLQECYKKGKTSL